MPVIDGIGDQRHQHGAGIGTSTAFTNSDEGRIGDTQDATVALVQDHFEPQEVSIERRASLEI